MNLSSVFSSNKFDLKDSWAQIMAAKNDGNKGLDTAIASFIDQVIQLEPKPSVELSGIDNELTRNLISRVLFRADSNLGYIPTAQRPEVSNGIKQEYRVSPDGRAWNRVTLLKALESADYITVPEKSRARNELHKLLRFAVDLEHAGAVKAVQQHGGFFGLDFEAKAMLYEKLGQEICADSSSETELFRGILFDGVKKDQQDERLSIILLSLESALNKGLLERGERLQKFLDSLAPVVAQLENHNVANTLAEYTSVTELREFCVSAITQRAKGDSNNFLHRLYTILNNSHSHYIHYEHECYHKNQEIVKAQQQAVQEERKLASVPDSFAKPQIEVLRQKVKVLEREVKDLKRKALTSKKILTALMTMSRDYLCGKEKFEGIEKLDGINSDILNKLSKLIRTINRHKDLRSFSYMEGLCRESLPALYNKEVEVLLKPLEDKTKSFEQLEEANQNKLIEALSSSHTCRILLQKAKAEELTACTERLSDKVLDELRALKENKYFEVDRILRLNEALGSLITIFRSGLLTGDVGLGNIKAICEGMVRVGVSKVHHNAAAVANEALQKMKSAGL